jgi:translation elongation factor EF-Tu-like GTPase
MKMKLKKEKNDLKTKMNKINMVYKFALIGHVDFGKSTLAGHLLCKVNALSLHEIATAEKDASGKLSGNKFGFLLDIDQNERTKGKTHEYTIVPFTFNNDLYELIDTPGHKQFIRSTIEALGKNSNITGVIVISVLPTEFAAGFGNGMIKEQVILMRATGITKIIICINKMDLVDYNIECFTKIKETLEPFIKTLKFTKVDYLPISAFVGMNLDKLLDLIKSNGHANDHGEKIKISNKLYTKCKIISGLITVGYSCTSHINGDEIQVTVDKIKDNVFIKINQVCEIKWCIDIPVDCYKNQKIILRSGENTIGFGIIQNKSLINKS